MAFLSGTFADFAQNMNREVQVWADSFSKKAAGPDGRAVVAAAAKTEDGTFKGNVAQIAANTLDRWDVLSGGKDVASLDRSAIKTGLAQEFQNENKFVRPEYRVNGLVPQDQPSLLNQTEEFVMKNDGNSSGLAEINLATAGNSLRDGVVTKQEMLNTNIGSYLARAGFNPTYVYPR
jgi:hypothetical protein